MIRVSVACSSGGGKLKVNSAVLPLYLPTIMKSRVSDSAHPIDTLTRRAQRGEANFGSEHPTDRPSWAPPEPVGSHFWPFSRIPASLRVGTTDRPTRIRPTQASRVFRPTDPLRGRSDTQSGLLTSLRQIGRRRLGVRASSARARCDVETHGVRHSTFTKHIPERYVNPVTPTHC